MTTFPDGEFQRTGFLQKDFPDADIERFVLHVYWEYIFEARVYQSI